MAEPLLPGAVSRGRNHGRGAGRLPLAGARWTAAAVLAAGCLGPWARPARAAEEIPVAACLECHAEEGAEPYVDGARFLASVHGDNVCTSCHSDIREAEHEVPLRKVDCSECHALESEIYLQSSHGKALLSGREMAASCRDCHGDPHQIVGSHDPSSPVAHHNIPATCAVCHGDAGAMLEFRLHQLAPIASYTNSVHGRAINADHGSAAAVCTDCHGSHDLQRSMLPDSKLHWSNIPTTCGKCHENIEKTFLRSVHGIAILDGNRDAPVCTDCHGEHTISAVKDEESKVFTSHIAETCGQCHAAERIISKYRMSDHTVDSYTQSYHGLAVRLGSLTAANCASCHGKHDILPSSDPRSSIHVSNLPKTCGICHAGVTAQVAQGQIHSGTRPGLEHRAVTMVRRIYIGLFVVVLGGMLLHNTLDLTKKLRKHFAEMAEVQSPHRMNLNQRVQHGLLILFFVSLAYTGFALNYPDAWWASIFVSSFDWRGYGHRVAAVGFTLLCAFHLWFVTCTRRGRWEIRQLAIRWSDVREFGQMMGYYLGFRAERAVFGRYSYIEKAEYWALVWGSMIMAITGAFMTWEEWTLRYFPKWLYDVMTAVHYYEAILACLAVIIWHFYFVMFDPEEYPVKWTFITGHDGRSDRDRLAPDSPPPAP